MGYCMVKKTVTICFHQIPELNGWTDGQTDGQICYINIARQYADRRRRFWHATHDCVA